MKPQTKSVLKALETGRALTATEARRSFGVKSLGARIHELRSQGYAVYTNRTKNGTSYRLGSPSRAMVAVAFATLGSAAFE